MERSSIEFDRQKVDLYKAEMPDEVIDAHIKWKDDLIKDLTDKPITPEERAEGLKNMGPATPMNETERTEFLHRLFAIKERADERSAQLAEPQVLPE